jgi:hypothetical protein
MHYAHIWNMAALLGIGALLGSLVLLFIAAGMVRVGHYMDRKRWPREQHPSYFAHPDQTR